VTTQDHEGYLGIPGAVAHVVETRSGRTGYIQAGSGPPLILLHGLGTSSETWGPTIQALAERFTVVAPDLAGHGKSSGKPLRGSVEPLVQALDDLCEHVGLETAAVVGHSLGGLVAIRFALKHPNRVTHLVLVDAGGIGKEMSWLLQLAAIPMLGKLVFGPSRLWIKHYHDRLIAPPGKVDTNLLRAIHRSRTLHVTADVMRRAIESSSHRLEPVESAYLLPRLDEIAAPVLVLWGEQDRLFPVEQLEGVRANCPEVEIHTFADVGHWPYAEVADAFNAKLVEFLDRRADG
jgi:pimeloyl-ACP methyl ester carboxylesterase